MPSKDSITEKVLIEMKEIKMPLIVVNFKAYHQTFGEKGLRLARIAEKVSEEVGVSVAICPPILNLAKYAEIFNIPVFSQRLDVLKDENSMGKVSVEMIKTVGVSGTLINHSNEGRNLADLEKVVRDSRTHQLFIIVRTNNEAVTAAVTKLDPHAIAFEPLEQTRSNISVSKINSEVIQDCVKRIKIENPKVSPLCGTGINSASDVAKALEYGTEGVVVSSSFVRAKDPYDLLMSLAETIIS